MSMRCVVIINHFLVQKVEWKVYYYCVLKLCLDLTKSPWHNLSQKSTELTTKLMCTIVLIQNINHSFIVVSRKYTNLNWQNNTFFSTKPCFLKKTVYDVSGDTLTHPQKTWICRKTCVILPVSEKMEWLNLHIQTLSAFFFLVRRGISPW